MVGFFDMVNPRKKNLRLAIKRMHEEKFEVVANCDHLSNLMENKGLVYV